MLLMNVNIIKENGGSFGFKKGEIMRIFKEIKWFWQRGKRGWADCDVWGFQDYLTDIIIA